MLIMLRGKRKKKRRKTTTTFAGLCWELGLCSFMVNPTLITSHKIPTSMIWTVEIARIDLKWLGTRNPCDVPISVGWRWIAIQKLLVTNERTNISIRPTEQPTNIHCGVENAQNRAHRPEIKPKANSAITPNFFEAGYIIKEHATWRW